MFRVDLKGFNFCHYIHRVDYNMAVLISKFVVVHATTSFLLNLIVIKQVQKFSGIFAQPCDGGIVPGDLIQIS